MHHARAPTGMGSIRLARTRDDHRRRFSRLVALALYGVLAACATRHADDRGEPVTTGGPPPAQRHQADPEMPAPRRVGLLLPLTGPYAEAARGIQDGFIGAHFHEGGDIAIRVYDTAASAGAIAAYEQALADGAQLVVGPLTKDNVRVVGAAQDAQVPVVALNYVDDVARRDFHQLGLAPEDEAREAARSAFAEGARSAVVLVPGNTWGRRLAGAFIEEFVALGGLVREQQAFGEDAYDFSPAIEAAFGIAESEARHHALSRTLGIRTEFEPRRRDDFDVVFIGATAETTRMLVPQLRFHYVVGIPIYGPATVHDGALASRHRDGLRFCGAPIVLDAAGRNAELRDLLNAAFRPRDLDSLRLLALGYDAYQFARRVLEPVPGSGRSVSGATGTLTTGPDGVVRRRLSCVEISGNELMPLPSDPVL